MLPSLRPAEPVYPTVAVMLALVAFVAGLFLVHAPWFWAYLVALTVLHVLFGYGRTVLRIVPLAVVIAGVTGSFSLIYAAPRQAYIYGIRLVLFGVSAVPTFGMDPMGLVRTMQRHRLPRWLSLGVLITMRFMTVMRTEIRRIRRAMTLRGVQTEWYRPRVIGRAFVMPLMVRILGISDLLAASLELRGFRMDGPMTVYRAPVFGRRDLGYLVGGLGIAAVALAVRIGGAA